MNSTSALIDVRPESAIAPADLAIPIFVSYRHGTDRAAMEQLQLAIRSPYYVVDGSVVRTRWHDDPKQFTRALLEYYLLPGGTTIVLASHDSIHSQHVDWEIAAALAATHALVIVRAPWVDEATSIEEICPPRALANLSAGYASVCHWTELLGEQRFRQVLDEAGSRDRRLLTNAMPIRKTDGRSSFLRQLFRR